MAVHIDLLHRLIAFGICNPSEQQGGKNPVAGPNSQMMNERGRNIWCHTDLRWITALKSSNSWIRVFKIRAVLLMGELGHWESETEIKSLFEMSGLYVLPWDGGCQVDVIHCASPLADDFYSTGLQ